MAKSQQIDVADLQRKFLANEISWQDALAAITLAGKRPWDAKAWKIKRESLIAKECANCGISDPPLVLQHTWHPTAIKDLWWQVRLPHRPEWYAWQESHPIKVDTSDLPLEADGCPKCSSTTIRYRIRAKTWVCVCKMGGVNCGHVFETPLKVVSPQKVYALEKATLAKMREEFDVKHDVGRNIVVRAIEEHLRYISLKDTITCCKRCAFVADKTNMVLCSECRKNYHAKFYDRCSKCGGIAPDA